MLAKLEGRDPLSLVLETIMCVRSRRVSSVGIVPLNRSGLTMKCLADLRLPSAEGMDPLILVFPARKLPKAVRVESDGGMYPLMAVPRIHKDEREVQLLSDLGIDPLMLLYSKKQVSIWARLENCSGIVPDKWLYPN